MNIELPRLCCPLCGGHRVEFLDWVTANGEELAGGDVGGENYCPDCEEHPSRLEERIVSFTLCAACVDHAFGTLIPLPGVRIGPNGAVERCEVCAIYESDREAGEALASEVARRNPAARARVRYFVEGYRAGDELTRPSSP